MEASDLARHHRRQQPDNPHLLALVEDRAVLKQQADAIR
jgi:hypothetical protein